jgi:hypothetical protein
MGVWGHDHEAPHKPQTRRSPAAFEETLWDEPRAFGTRGL